MAATAVKGLAHHPHLTENAAEVLARHFRVGRAVEESDYTWALELLTMCTQTALSALQNWHVPDVANWDCCLAYNWADGCLPEGIRELLPCGDGAEELMLSAESVSVRVVGRSRLDWSSGDRDWAITVVRYALMTRCGLARTRYCQSTRCP